MARKPLDLAKVNSPIRQRLFRWNICKENFSSRAACYHPFLSFFFRFLSLSLSLSIFAFSVRQIVPTSLLFMSDFFFQSIKKKLVFLFSSICIDIRFEFCVLNNALRKNLYKKLSKYLFKKLFHWNLKFLCKLVE